MNTYKLSCPSCNAELSPVDGIDTFYCQFCGAKIVLDGTSDSKRQEIKKLISELKKVNPFVETNIFKSVENVNLNTVIEYKKDGVRHNFLETYDD